jgi:hypothetical protein
MRYTTIEEGEKLISLGLKPETQDVYFEQRSDGLTDPFEYRPFIGKHIAIENNLFSYRKGYVKPSWSLDSLIEMLPDKVDIDGITMFLRMGKKTCEYGYRDDDYAYHSEISKKCSNLFDSVYEMVTDLLTRKLI